VTAQIALIIVGCVCSALLTFAVVYMREIKATFKDGQQRQDGRIAQIEDKLNDMPEKYVFREDFIRWTIGIDKKIDDVAKDVKALIKQEGKDEH
jgi:hypothetical protein